jgi:hypothetical protein
MPVGVQNFGGDEELIAHAADRAAHGLLAADPE